MWKKKQISDEMDLPGLLSRRIRLESIPLRSWNKRNKEEDKSDVDWNQPDLRKKNEINKTTQNPSQRRERNDEKVRNGRRFCGHKRRILIEMKRALEFLATVNFLLTNNYRTSCIESDKKGEANDIWRVTAWPWLHCKVQRSQVEANARQLPVPLDGNYIRNYQRTNSN